MIMYSSKDSVGAEMSNQWSGDKMFQFHTDLLRNPGMLFDQVEIIPSDHHTIQPRQIKPLCQRG